MGKTVKEQVQDYINDLRWKQVTSLTKELRLEEAATLSNEIINSYPAHVKEATKNLHQSEQEGRSI